jgi:Mg2+/Co2+ transporter CorB
LTFIIGIFAEIAPKTLAAFYPERAVQWIVFPIQIIINLFYPLVWAANHLANGLLYLLHIRIKEPIAEPLTREELRSVVYDTKGKISRQYQHMLLSILDMDQLTVDDVMVPRRDIMGIDIAANWPTVCEELARLQLECVPVFRHDINQVAGVLYGRDVMRLLLAQKKLDPTSLEKLLKAPYFVPSGTRLNIQLEHFQHAEEKYAFVLDEYGDVQGMLTLNDILEEIVGDFTSGMSAAKRIILQADGSYLVEGAITIREFNRTTEWELPLGGPKTINGLIVEYLEALPHEKSSILIADYPIEVIKVSDNRVKQARIYPRLQRNNLGSANH